MWYPFHVMTMAVIFDKAFRSREVSRCSTLRASQELQYDVVLVKGEFIDILPDFIRLHPKQEICNALLSLLTGSREKTSLPSSGRRRESERVWKEPSMWNSELGQD